MSERENILGRIREGLRITAYLPGSHHDAPTGGTPAAGTARAWLPKVGESAAEQLAQFAANAAELKVDFHLVASSGELEARLRALRDGEKWQRIAAHRASGVTPLAESLGLPVLFTDGGYDKHELEACSVGITACDALVAQTGSVLITSRSAGGRALSVLPPHHVVIARRAQLVRDLPAAFERLEEIYARNYPSMISFVTGPSRTGDIERILVLGAHGPKKLTIFCLPD
jgi:L-lactate dehydrogenase complex protein LldG